MIDPKYADLPGIAYDQPDIYETDDVSENVQFQNDTQDDGDSVEKIYIDTSDAYDKFKGKSVSCKRTDFSDSISPRRKMGYNVSGGEWELSCRDENETPLQKYQRLRYEIQQLLDQINLIKENMNENKECKSLTDVIYQIEIIGKELDAANIDKLLSGYSITSLSNYQDIRFKELKSQIEVFKQQSNIENNLPINEVNLPVQEMAKFGMLKYQMIYFPDKAKVQDIARISYLEKRLGYLENVIGMTNDNNAKCSQILRSQGITKSVEKLMTNASLLNSTQLDVLENKVASLIHKMDVITQKKTLILQDIKHEKIITELFDLVKQTEKFSVILPQTVDRLLSLSSLHRKAADFLNQLKELEALQQNIDESLNNNKTLLEGMKTNFGNNLEIIANDITLLNERVKKLKI